MNIIAYCLLSFVFKTVVFFIKSPGFKLTALECTGSNCPKIDILGKSELLVNGKPLIIGYHAPAHLQKYTRKKLSMV